MLTTLVNLRTSVDTYSPSDTPLTYSTPFLTGSLPLQATGQLSDPWTGKMYKDHAIARP